jgi:hypothetical protein
MKNKKEFSLKQYSTIEELECASWDNEITIKDLYSEANSAGTVDNNGNEEEMSWAHLKKCYEEAGYWGFIDSRDNTIHFWIKQDYPITMEELLFFFGHEMGHQMNGGLKPTEEEYNDNAEAHFKEEDRADEYGYVAKMAYEFASKILSKKKND